MTPLVEQLKIEHEALLNNFQDVLKTGVAKPAGIQKLMATKLLLLRHLRREENEMYPVLQRGAATNEALRTMLDDLAAEYEELARHLMDFFERYENGGEGLQFARELGKLQGMLSSRIRREENRVYPVFEKLAL